MSGLSFVKIIGPDSKAADAKQQLAITPFGQDKFYGAGHYDQAESGDLYYSAAMGGNDLVPYEMGRVEDHAYALTAAKTSADGEYEDIFSAARGSAYDAAIAQFQEILDSHRVNCERMGKYAEADIARQRLVEVKVHELQRKKEAMRARQLADMLAVEEQHMITLARFNQAWDLKFMQFEQESEATLAHLQEKHASDLRTYQTRLLMKSQVPRHSSEYFNLRKIEEHLAKQNRYTEAAATKQKADDLGAYEEEQWNAERQTDLLRAENHYKEKLAMELEAVTRRIAQRRAENSRKRQLELEHLLMQYTNAKQDTQRRHTLERQRFDKFLTIEMRRLRVEAGRAK